MRARLFCADLALWKVLAVLVLIAAPTVVAAQEGYAREVHELFATHCYRCHGENGTNEGGLNYVLDRDRLVARRKLVPGAPGKSRLFKRLTNIDDPMPPDGEQVRPTKDEIQLVADWIAAGAPSATPAAPTRAFVPPNEVLRIIRADLDNVPERTQRFTRYFTLTHLANAGLSADELRSYRHGLSKRINSLSWNGQIVAPRPIDAAATIFRIDLRNYQWNEKTWEILLAANPYGVAIAGDSAEALYQATQCRQPHVRADWFVAAASGPPLYHDLLRLPATLGDLEKAAAHRRGRRHPPGKSCPCRVQ